MCKRVLKLKNCLFLLQCPQLLADRTDEYSCSYACGSYTTFDYTTNQCLCGIEATPNPDGMTCDYINCQEKEYVNEEKKCQQVCIVILLLRKGILDSIECLQVSDLSFDITIQLVTMCSAHQRSRMPHISHPAWIALIS